MYGTTIYSTGLPKFGTTTAKGATKTANGAVDMNPENINAIFNRFVSDIHGLGLSPIAVAKFGAEVQCLYWELLGTNLPAGSVVGNV